MSSSFETLYTESVMLDLFGDLKISTVFGPKHNCFVTRFLIFSVQVALKATALAWGNKDRSSPIQANHFLKACLFSPLWSSPLKNTRPHNHDDILVNDYLSLNLKYWFWISVSDIPIDKRKQFFCFYF